MKSLTINKIRFAFDKKLGEGAEGRVVEYVSVRDPTLRIAVKTFRTFPTFTPPKKPKKPIKEDDSVTSYLYNWWYGKKEYPKPKKELFETFRESPVKKNEQYKYGILAGIHCSKYFANYYFGFEGKIVMQLLRSDVAKYLEIHGHKLARIMFILARVTHALDCLNKNGVVYNDLKAENVLVNYRDDGTITSVKLGDVGSVTLFGQREEGTYTHLIAIPHDSGGSEYTDRVTLRSFAFHLFGVQRDIFYYRYGRGNDNLTSEQLDDAIHKYATVKGPWAKKVLSTYANVTSPYSTLLAVFGMYKLHTRRMSKMRR